MTEIESKILESLKSTLKDVNNMSLKEFTEIGEPKLVKELENIPLEITSSKEIYLLRDGIMIPSLTYEQRVYILIEALKIQKEISVNYNSLNSGTSFLNERILIQIFRRWGNDDDDIDGVFCDLASNYECPKSILKYLAESFKYCNPTTILDAYIQSRQKYDTGSVFSYVVKRVLEAYGIIDSDIKDSVDWNWLLENAKEYEDEEAVDFIQDLRDKSLEPSSKSKFSKVSHSNSKSLSSIPKISDFLKMFQISDLDENLQNQKFEDILSEIYGPENEIEGMDCISGILRVNLGVFSQDKSPKINPGIRNTCRMYTCMCREYDRDFEDESLNEVNVEHWEWFKGVCQTCDKIIKDYKKAIRAPVEGGGWVGCFCSEKCL